MRSQSETDKFGFQIILWKSEKKIKTKKTFPVNFSICIIPKRKGSEIKYFTIERKADIHVNC